MTVPAMLIMSGLRLIQRQSDDRSRGRELAIQRAHEREVLRMEIEAAGQRHERQKAVLLAILEASERLAVLKLEHMMTIFREAKGVMLAHQTALVEEKSSLTSILLASEVLSSGEEADAKTIGTLLNLSHELGKERPHVVVELADGSAVDIVTPYAEDVLVSPRIAADFLGHVVLRRELHGVFADLVGGGGTDLRLVTASELDIVGRSLTFAELAEEGRARRMVVLGVSLVADDGPRLLPSPKDRFELTDEDCVVLVR